MKHAVPRVHRGENGALINPLSGLSSLISYYILFFFPSVLTGFFLPFVPVWARPPRPAVAVVAALQSYVVAAHTCLTRARRVARTDFTPHGFHPARTCEMQATLRIQNSFASTTKRTLSVNVHVSFLLPYEL